MITQFGILTSSDVFYENFLYKALAPAKNNLRIQSYREGPDTSSRQWDLSHFPSRPDSLPRYLHFKLQSVIRLNFIMLGMYGFSEFLTVFLRKLLFLVLTSKYERLLKFKYLLQLGGLTLLLYYYGKETRISLRPSETVILKIYLVLS